MKNEGVWAAIHAEVDSAECQQRAVESLEQAFNQQFNAEENLLDEQAA